MSYLKRVELREQQQKKSDFKKYEILYQHQSLSLWAAISTDHCHYQLWSLSIRASVTTQHCHYQHQSSSLSASISNGHCHYQHLSIPITVSTTHCHYQHLTALIRSKIHHMASSRLEWVERSLQYWTKRGISWKPQYWRVNIKQTRVYVD